MRSYKKLVGLLSTLMIVSALLGACAAPTPEVVEKVVTQVVQETVLVEGTPQVVEKEVTRVVQVEVEKEVVVTATPEPQAEKKILYLSSNEVPKALNTFLTDSGSDGEALFYVHCRLGQFGPDQSIIPYAADWKLSADGLTYTFYINENAKWHDGEPVTAQDVVFTYKLVANSQSGSVYFGRIKAIKGAQAYYDGTADDIEGLRLVDDKTVKMTLDAPSPSFLALSQGSMLLLPEHILGGVDVEDVWDSSYWRNPIGCGPYKWVEYVPDQYIHYEKFADFFLGEPKIDEIYLKFGTEEANAIAFEKGELDIVQLGGTDYERFGQMGVTMHGGPGTVENLVVNNKRPWLDNIKFRKAMLYAIDRQALVDAAWFGYSSIAANPFDTAWTLSPNYTQYPYDPDQAKALLAEIGWDGSVEFELLLGTGAAYRERMTVIIQQNLADVGIKINISMVEGAVRNERMAAGDFDMAILGYGGMSQTPWIAASVFTSAALPPVGENWAWYEDPELDALFAQAAVEMNPTALTQVFYQITELMTDRLPMLPLIIDERIAAQSDRVVIPNLALIPRNQPGKNTWLTWNVYEWDIAE